MGVYWHWNMMPCTLLDKYFFIRITYLFIQDKLQEIWKQHVPPKRSQQSIKQHGVTYQKAVRFCVIRTFSLYNGIRIMIRGFGLLMVTRGFSHIIDITLCHFYYFHMCV